MPREKTPGRPFKKGQSGNPGGRRKPDPLIRAVRETTYKEFIIGLQKFGSMNQQELTAELKRADATMFELMFGQIVASAAKGDKDARAVLLDRLWGKVKDVPLVEKPSEIGPQVVITIPDNGRSVLTQK